MAAQEMYDYLPTVTPDYTAATLTVTPSNVLTEQGEYTQIVHETDDLSTYVTTLGVYPIFYVTLQWEHLSAADAGTIVDFYFNSSKGYGQARSFYWQHPLDGHTYVVKFASPLPREFRAGLGQYHSIAQIRLRVIGRKAD